MDLGMGLQAKHMLGLLLHILPLSSSGLKLLRNVVRLMILLKSSLIHYR